MIGVYFSVVCGCCRTSFVIFLLFIFHTCFRLRGSPCPNTGRSVCDIARCRSGNATFSLLSLRLLLCKSRELDAPCRSCLIQSGGQCCDRGCCHAVPRGYSNFGKVEGLVMTQLQQGVFAIVLEQASWWRGRPSDIRPPSVSLCRSMLSLHAVLYITNTYASLLPSTMFTSLQGPTCPPWHPTPCSSHFGAESRRSRHR